MKTPTLRSFRCSLAWLVAGVVPGIGCDSEAEFDGGSADIVEQDFDAELEEYVDDAAAVVPLDHAPAPVLSNVNDPSAAVTISYSRRSVLLTSTLTEGDAVMLRSKFQGYLGCDADGNVSTSKTPQDLDGRIWQVHLADIDSDGDDEMQFELLDSSGGTGMYLKMKGSGLLHCNTITGIGDAAAWNWGQWYGEGGSIYHTVSRSLINYKQGLCFHATSIGEVGATCNHHINTLFNLEILDTDVL